MFHETKNTYDLDIIPMDTHVCVHIHTPHTHIKINPVFLIQFKSRLNYFNK